MKAWSFAIKKPRKESGEGEGLKYATRAHTPKINKQSRLMSYSFAIFSNPHIQIVFNSLTVSPTHTAIYSSS